MWFLDSLNDNFPSGRKFPRQLFFNDAWVCWTWEMSQFTPTNPENQIPQTLANKRSPFLSILHALTSNNPLIRIEFHRKLLHIFYSKIRIKASVFIWDKNLDMRNIRFTNSKVGYFSKIIPREHFCSFWRYSNLNVSVAAKNRIWTLSSTCSIFGIFLEFTSGDCNFWSFWSFFHLFLWYSFDNFSDFLRPFCATCSEFCCYINFGSILKSPNSVHFYTYQTVKWKWP